MFEVQDLELRLEGLGFQVSGLRFQGLGLRAGTSSQGSGSGLRCCADGDPHNSSALLAQRAACAGPSGFN